MAPVSIQEEFKEQYDDVVSRLQSKHFFQSDWDTASFAMFFIFIGEFTTAMSDRDIALTLYKGLVYIYAMANIDIFYSRLPHGIYTQQITVNHLWFALSHCDPPRPPSEMCPLT